MGRKDVMGENELLMHDYRHYSDFRRYVDRHCRSYGCTLEEALQNFIVREVRKYYEEERRLKTNGSLTVCLGCGT